MLLAKGVRVRFKRTGEQGVIRELLGSGMLLVYLPDSDLEIPAFDDELELADKSIFVKAPPATDKKKEAWVPPRLEADIGQYTILKSSGLQLCFLPCLRADDTIEHFEVYLINDTQQDLIYTLQCEVKGRKLPPGSGKLPAVSIMACGKLPLDMLNENPEYHIECWLNTTAGTEGHRTKSLRIKPQQFFKKLRTVPLLNKRAYWYVVFDKIKPEKTDSAAKASKEDLLSYTRRVGKSGKKAPKTARQRMELYDPAARAAFEPVIDLHIEKLRPDFVRRPPEVILLEQLAAFDHFVEQALRLGVSPVFVIHGLGKGKLREEIARRLDEHPHVKLHKNEYHPLYGHGATEIEFGQ